MQLDRQQVAHVARLARIQLNEVDLQRLTGDLAQIIAYIEQLDELDTAGVEPMAHAVDMANVFADDELAASLPRDEALANAPKHDGEFFRVPAVL